MKIGTIITIGALGALVLLVVVIVIIFFWQRHSSPLDGASSSPVSPKISRSSTNQLIADVAKGLASHFDSPEPNTDCYASFRPSANLTVPTERGKYLPKNYSITIYFSSKSFQELLTIDDKFYYIFWYSWKFIIFFQ